ncbi:MAG: tetratricopeptide repeat protein [Ignavibacteria bacterium]|jgi:tetratricopeptide (TPR) repeat protein|nr:tetratricopeptide repeat protein [Ignavibacteria bacterium]MCU7503644.1 tetratricopeptide repeat protein [Ignavibacteria bacterium]MCU7517873.1 tetratricopeptide repeat protein [Ignavibacteria bacterium]
MKYLSVVILVLFSIKFTFASEEENRMLKANNFYQEGKFDRAVEIYQKLADEGFSGKELFYNLGNAYFKSGMIGYAILNYEKAQKISPNDEDITYNLKIANARTVDKIEAMPKIFLVRWWEELLNYYPVNGWTVVTYFIYLALLGVIGWYFFSRGKSRQRWIVISGLAIAVIFIFSLVVLVSKYTYDNGKEYAVVTESAVTVKLSPDEHSGDAFIIHEGIKLSLEDKVDKWVKIKLADGKVGWLTQADMKKI